MTSAGRASRMLATAKGRTGRSMVGAGVVVGSGSLLIGMGTQSVLVGVGALLLSGVALVPSAILYRQSTMQARRHEQLRSRLDRLARRLQSPDPTAEGARVAMADPIRAVPMEVQRRLDMGRTAVPQAVTDGLAPSREGQLIFRLQQEVDYVLARLEGARIAAMPSNDGLGGTRPESSDGSVQS